MPICILNLTCKCKQCFEFGLAFTFITFSPAFLNSNRMNTGVKTYKYCIVPLCTSTTSSTPDKLFFLVPKNKEMRKKWCEVMNRDEPKYPELSSKTALYCCENHFDVSILKHTHFVFVIDFPMLFTACDQCFLVFS